MKVASIRSTRGLLLVSSLIIGTLQSPLAVADDVRYRIMPYLWTAGMDVEIGRPGMTTQADVEFSDYLDFIDMVQRSFSKRVATNGRSQPICSGYSSTTI